MDHPTINRAKNIIANVEFYRECDKIECITDLVKLFEKEAKQDINSEIISKMAVELKEKQIKLNKKEIIHPRDTLAALRATPVVMLTEKYDGGQFTGSIEQYQYKYNGLVYTFIFEDTCIIEAYTENEIN